MLPLAFKVPPRAVKKSKATSALLMSGTLSVLAKVTSNPPATSPILSLAAVPLLASTRSSNRSVNCSPALGAAPNAVRPFTNSEKPTTVSVPLLKPL